MSDSLWRFPTTDGGENKGIGDSGLETFADNPLKSLAREICQNSIDACANELEPVRVDFKLFDIPLSNIPEVEALRKILKKCSDFYLNNNPSDKDKDFFYDALDTLDSNIYSSCKILRISDFNTKGLPGAHKKYGTPWHALIKAVGSSTGKNDSSGGSFGIGKFASYLTSRLRTVFYSTLAKENKEESYEGVCRLPSFIDDNDNMTQGTGYYGDQKCDAIFEQLHMDPNFKRAANEFGTDIFIIAFKYADEKWDDVITCSVIDNFMVAVLNKQLIVNAGNICISSETINQLITKYKNTDILPKNSPYYFDVLTSNETTWFESPQILGKGEVKIGILAGNPEYTKKIALFRKTGMKIMDKSKQQGNNSFMGVLVVTGDKTNKILRAMEDPTHTKWIPSRAGSREYLANFTKKEIFKFIEDSLSSVFAVDETDSVDAIGIGKYLPDYENDDSQEKKTSENIEEKVVNIDTKKKDKEKNQGVRAKDPKQTKRTTPAPDEEDNNDSYYHPGGKTVEPTYKTPNTPSRDDENGKNKIPEYIPSYLEKFIPIAVDYKHGKYSFVIYPSENSNNGKVRIFLSAETQKYDVQIISAKIIGNNSCTLDVKGSEISSIPFEKGKRLALAVELDYQDYCPLEIEAYALKK